MGISISCPNGDRPDRHLLKRCTCNINAAYHLIDADETPTPSNSDDGDKNAKAESKSKIVYHRGMRIREIDGTLWFY